MLAEVAAVRRSCMKPSDHPNDAGNLQRKPCVCYVITDASSTRLLRGQLTYLIQRGFEVALISGPGPALESFRAAEHIACYTVPITRAMAPLSDLRALYCLVKTLRRIRPQVVNASTPKAGLLGMLAAWFCRVPVRLYGLRGLRLETVSGLGRHVLVGMEKIASACAHEVVCVSHSLRRAYVEQGLAPLGKTAVLGQGSSNGVAAHEFLMRGSPEAEQVRRDIRTRLGIPDSVPVIGAVGRVNADKGCRELLAAFRQLSTQYPDAHLLVLGDIEATGGAAHQLKRGLEQCRNVHITGFQSDPAAYYCAMDVLAHPSLREGFPNAILEASAACLPAVGFRVTGVVDAIVDGETGVVVEVGDERGLVEALASYLASPQLAELHGNAARARVVRSFSREAVWGALEQQYRQHLAKRGLATVKPSQHHRQCTAA